MSRPVLAATVVLTVITLLRLFVAFNFPLTADETYYWSWSLHPSYGYTDHPPMVAWFIWLGTRFGHAAGHVRLLFVLGEAVAAIALGVAAAAFAGDRRAGAFAALVFTLIPQTKLEIGESLPDGPYVTMWALALCAAALLARRPSMSMAVGLGLALAGTVLSRMFGWALVFGIAGWMLSTRRELWRYLLVALGVTVLAYVPFLVWNASVGWENFAFTFVHRQTIGGASAERLANLSSQRLLLYGVLIVALTWWLCLRRTPRLSLVAWTAIPLPVALGALSFTTQTESYWLIGPAASLSLALGIRLAETTALRRRATFGVLGVTTAYATLAALLVAVPESAQAAAFRLHPMVRSAVASGVFAYPPLADDVRTAAAGRVVVSDYYETSAELLFYGVPSLIVGTIPQVPQWSRWYRPPEVPQSVLFVSAFAPPADDLRRRFNAAYERVGAPKRLDYAFAGGPEASYYLTTLDGARPAAATVFPGL